MSIKFTVFALVKDYEKRIGRNVSLGEMARLIDIDARTLSAAMSGDMQRVDLAVMSKLLAFFESEGMPVSINDLFTITPKESHHGQS